MPIMLAMMPEGREPQGTNDRPEAQHSKMGFNRAFISVPLLRTWPRLKARKPLQPLAMSSS